MAYSLPLENFGEREGENNESRESDAYERGFHDGFLEASQKSESRRSEAISELVQRISDIEISFDEARLSTLESLSPLFEKIVSSVLPSLQGESALSQALAYLEETARKDTEHGLIIKALGPAHDALLLALRDLEIEGVSLQEGDSETVALQGTGESILDVELLQSIIKNGMDSLRHHQRKELKNGTR